MEPYSLPDVLFQTTHMNEPLHGNITHYAPAVGPHPDQQALYRFVSDEGIERLGYVHEFTGI